MKYFVELVGHGVVLRAGFNHWEKSFFVNKGEEDYTVYHTKVPVTDTNIVVISSKPHQNKDGYVRNIWYFGTFLGKHSGECKTKEEINEFFDKVRSVITRKNRVAGRDLEWLIVKATREAFNN